MTIAEALKIAVEHHQAGRLDQAERIYRQILAVESDHPDALHLLGLVENQRRNFPVAEAMIRKSLEKCPRAAFIWSDLALILLNQDRLIESLEVCGKSLELDPGQHTVLHYMGIIYSRMNQPQRAIELFQRVLGINPGHFDAWLFLADALHKAGRVQEALELNEKLIVQYPNLAVLRNNQGNVLLSMGRVKEAIESLQRAISLDPNFAEAYNNLGNVYGKTRQTLLAVESFRKAIGLNPRLHEAHNNLGNALKDMGRFDEALSSYQNALALWPDYADVHTNLGILYKNMGLMDASLDAFRKSLSLASNPETHSNLIFTMQYHPGCSMEQIRGELQKWSDEHAKGLESCPASFPPVHPQKLRIGFVSEDLRLHPVGRFLLPLLANLDRERFFIACYSNSIIHDVLSDRLKACSDLWVESIAMTHQQLDQRIRDDGIHILIDLAAHTAGNRLMVFARRPAPVQITWLAYCGSTGLRAMDYRISDPYMDPPGLFDGFYSEKTLLLPTTYWCYSESEEHQPVSALPRLGKGFITFGCLNNFCKISPLAMECWIEILKRVEGSRLMVHAGDGKCRGRFAGAFEKAGVDFSRLGFVPYLPQDKYLGAYQDIDIALDPFPYNGGTTSCDAVWMGVPLIALAGDRPVGQAGLSILSNLGLEELVARDPKEYVELAVRLASDVPRLQTLRQTLRDRMRGSALMDQTRFASDFSALLIRAWNEKAGGVPCNK